MVLLHLSLALGLSLSAFAQTEKAVVLNPEKPQPGGKLEISYNAKESSLGDSKDVKGTVYLYCNYKWITKDLSLNYESNNWKGTLDVPSDCGLLALKFKSNGKIDNNGNNGYVWMLQKADQSSMPGANAAWGLMRSPDYGYSIPNYIDLEKFAVNDTVTYMWINTEIVKNSVSAAPMAMLFANSLYRSHVDGAEQRMKNIAAFLIKQNTEESLVNAAVIYKNLLGMAQPADSLTKVILDRYPKGAIARLNAYRAASKQSDMKKKRQALAQFLIDFPESPADAQYNENNMINYDKAYEMIVLIDTMDKNYSSLQTYLNQLSFSASITLFYKLIQIPHDRKDIPDQELYQYAKLLVDHMESIKSVKPAQYYYLSPKEWEEEWQNNMAKTVLITYIDLLKNVGKNKEALSYALQAQQSFNYTVADVNNSMISLLTETGDKEGLKKLLIGALYNNQVTPLMLDLLKKEYIAEHNSEAGFDEFIKSHKDPKLVANELKSLDGNRREGVMPAWKMMDIDGKLIDSNNLKGKTYVLDFWSSWCVPCKASFPGMKLAVERYKNDPSVEFYFVDTEEHSADYKATAIKYIKENNYPFHVLFDNKLKGAKINDEVFSRIAKAFTISGIPQKIFVDGNGNVQFISIGYKGSPSELADEISGMVELTKNIK